MITVAKTMMNIIGHTIVSVTLLAALITVDKSVRSDSMNVTVAFAGSSAHVRDGSVPAKVDLQNHSTIYKSSDSLSALDDDSLDGVVDSIAEEEADDPTAVASTVSLPFDTLICNGEEVALALAETFTLVGSRGERFSVAYDALIEKTGTCAFIGNVEVANSPLYYEHAAGSGVIAVLRVVECVDCAGEYDPDQLYAILLTEDIARNIFQCERNRVEYSEAGFDHALACRQDT